MSFVFLFLSIRGPPRATRSDTLFPYTTLFRSAREPVWATAAAAPSSDAPPLSRITGFRRDTFRATRRKRRGVLMLSRRSEEHTSELQSLMRISYAVFCVKKKNSSNNKFTRTVNNSDQTRRHLQQDQYSRP